MQFSLSFSVSLLSPYLHQLFFFFLFASAIRVNVNAVFFQHKSRLTFSDLVTASALLSVLFDLKQLLLRINNNRDNPIFTGSFGNCTEARITYLSLPGERFSRHPPAKMGHGDVCGFPAQHRQQLWPRGGSSKSKNKSVKKLCKWPTRPLPQRTAGLETNFMPL